MRGFHHLKSRFHAGEPLEELRPLRVLNHSVSPSLSQLGSLFSSTASLYMIYDRDGRAIVEDWAKPPMEMNMLENRRKHLQFMRICVSARRQLNCTPLQSSKRPTYPCQWCFARSTTSRTDCRITARLCKKSLSMTLVGNRRSGTP